MAWNESKVLPANINGGQEFVADDQLVASDVNAAVNNGLYASNLADVNKTKLDTIEEGAEVNVVEKVQLNGSDLTITDKTVNVTTIGDASSDDNLYGRKNATWTIIDPDLVYDIKIETQAEFDALIASATWLGAKSVLFDGTNGAFIKSDGGIRVPNTVTDIAGINNAVITITATESLHYGISCQHSILLCNIKDLFISVSGSVSASTLRGVDRFNNINNVNISITNNGIGGIYGMWCQNLISNCGATLICSSGNIYGLRGKYVNNCSINYAGSSTDGALIICDHASNIEINASSTVIIKYDTTVSDANIDPNTCDYYEYPEVAITLAAADWSEAAQTKAVTGLTAAHNPTINWEDLSDADFEIVGNAGMRAKHSSGNIIFTCIKDVPTSDITLTIQLSR